MTNTELYLYAKAKNGSGGGAPTPTPADVPYKDYPVQIEVDNLPVLPANTFNGLVNLQGAKLSSGLTEISVYAFYGCTSLLEIDVPSSVTSIGEKAIGYDSNGELINGFMLYGQYGTAAEEYALNNNITFADRNATFAYSVLSGTNNIVITNCSGQRTYIVVPRFLDGYKVAEINDMGFQVSTLVIRNGITKINYVAQGDPSGWGMSKLLKKLVLPNTLTTATTVALGRCTNLSEIYSESEFDATGLNCSACPLTYQSIIGMFNALADRTSLTAKTLTLGSTNLAKLSNAEIAIATEKNWTLA